MRILKELRERLSTYLAVRFGLYWTYEDIPLRIYVDIVNTGNLKLLCRRGIYSNQVARKRWEELVRRAAVSSTYSKVLVTSKTLAKKYNEYLLVRSVVIVLSFGWNEELVRLLDRMGYRVDRSRYAESLAEVLAKNENNITQLNVLRNEMRAYDAGTVSLNFHQMIASLSVALGFRVDPGILLAEYNELVQLLKREKKK